MANICNFDQIWPKSLGNFSNNLSLGETVNSLSMSKFQIVKMVFFLFGDILNKPFCHPAPEWPASSVTRLGNFWKSWRHSLTKFAQILWYLKTFLLCKKRFGYFLGRLWWKLGDLILASGRTLRQCQNNFIYLRINRLTLSNLHPWSIILTSDPTSLLLPLNLSTMAATTASLVDAFRRVILPEASRTRFRTSRSEKIRGWRLFSSVIWSFRE